MSVEVRTLELVTDSTKSISDLKSFEEAIGSLSSKLLAFNTAKEKAFKDLASDWTRLGKQLKPIRLEVSFAGLSAKFRQFQRHLLSHLAETQAMVDRHKIVLRTTTSIAGAAGVGAAAQVSAATATKQMTDQALFTGVMGKKFAEQDLRRLQSNKTMPRMTADMDTLLRDHWNMTKKQIEGFYGKYNQLQTNDQKRIEQMLRQTFSPAMATGRAQRQANWVTELAKQEGWHMQIIRPFLQEIQQKHAFVKEDPTPERLRQIARDYYASQGGKVGQRQINLDDLAQSAGAAWYKDPKLMGAQRNVLDQISSGQYKRSQIIASRSHLRGGQYVDLLAQADKNILRRDFSDLRSSLSVDQPITPFTKENLTQGKVMRHPEENLKAFINKQLGIYEDNRGKLLAQIKKDLEVLDTKQYFDIDDATYEREKKRLTDRAKQLQKYQYSSKRAASVTHAQRQSDLEYAFRNMPFQEVGAYNQDVSKKLVDELYGTKAKRLESLQSKIEGSERTDIGKRAEFLQKEIDLIDHKRFLIEKATVALTKENQVASKSAILSKAHEIETNLLKQNNLYEKRGKLLEHLQLIEKRAAQYADVDTIKKSQDLQKRLDTTRKTVIDPSDTKQVNKFANEIDRASKETDKLQKSFDRAHRSGGIMNSVLGKTGMALTAIAASIFILQNVYMWIQAALAPTMEFEGALRKLDQQNNVLKEDYGALKTIINDAFTSGAMSVEAATGKFQEMRNAGYTTQEALVSVQREMARLNDINLDYAVGQFDRLAGAVKNLLNIKGNWLGNLVGAAADKALYMGANEQQQQEYDKFEQLIEKGKYELAKRQGQYSYAKDFLGKNEETLNKLQKNIQDQELYLRQLKETQKMFINPTAQPIDSWRSQSAQELAKTGYSGGMVKTRTESLNADIRANELMLQNEKNKIKLEKENKSAQNKVLMAIEKAEREHMEAFRQALKVAESKWDFSSVSPEVFFKDTLGQRGLTVDTEEKQRLFQSAVDKFNNKIVSWQNAFGKIAADDTLSKELNKIAALERKAVAEHLDLAQAYENLTGNTKPLKDVLEKLRYEAYKVAVEADFNWAFKETHGYEFMPSQGAQDKYNAYRDSIIDSGPKAEQQSKLRRLNAIEEAFKDSRYLQEIDPELGGKTTRQQFLDYQKNRIKEGAYYTSYEEAFFKKTPYGATEDMTQKEKNIFEKQGHFTEMANAALMDYADEAEKTATKTYQAFQRAFTGMEDAMVGFVMTGKLEWKSLAQSIIADIVRIQVQSAITGPLAQGLAPKSSGGGGWLSTAFNFVTGLFSAQGNMFNRYGLIPFATGGIVTKPTMFAFGQGGIGVMGEAGPEAIMPVTRTPSGDLGVKAVGGSGMTVNIYEAPGTKARVEQSSNGMNMNVIIEQIENAIAGRMSRDGGLSRFMDARYQKNR